MVSHLSGGPQDYALTYSTLQITAGEVHGSIAHPAGGDWFGVTVTFTDDPEPFNTHATVARVTRAINFAASFDAELVERSWIIGSSKDFVQKVSLARGDSLGLVNADVALLRCRRTVRRRVRLRRWEGWGRRIST